MSTKKSRLRRGLDEWQAIIGAQQAAVESIPEYCRKHNINQKSFYIWRKRLNDAGRKPKSTEFIRIESEYDDQVKVLIIQTPGGYCLKVPEGVSATTVKTILSVISSIT